LEHAYFTEVREIEQARGRGRVIGLEEETSIEKLGGRNGVGSRT